MGMSASADKRIELDAKKATRKGGLFQYELSWY